MPAAGRGPAAFRIETHAPAHHRAARQVSSSATHPQTHTHSHTHPSAIPASPLRLPTAAPIPLRVLRTIPQCRFSFEAASPTLPASPPRNSPRAPCGAPEVEGLQRREGCEGGGEGGGAWGADLVLAAIGGEGRGSELEDRIWGIRCGGERAKRGGELSEAAR